ncbi:DUF4352 domain-containing protein [Nonomuraea sp. NPDC048826]|uniref:DUF4352 domain-containing protein n=1 Tax=Nonomuraea sp. NPDC048826 TaxID=3364347 RepID=UPI00371648DD
MSYPPGPPPGQQPPYGYGGYGPPPPPPPRKSNLALILVLAIGLPLLLLGGCAAVLLTLASSDAGRTPVATDTATPEDEAPTQDPSQDPSPEPSGDEQPVQGGKAALGETLTLTGFEGAEVAVTVEKLIAPATPENEYIKPKAGHRLVAVQVTLANQAQSPYEDAPYNGARLIDAEDQQHSPAYHDVREGQSLAGSVTVSAGDKRKGLIVFELPDGAEPATFQFGLNSGFADQKGEWALR